MFTRFKFGTASPTLIAPVGFGADRCGPPSNAQEPTAITAAAFPQTCFAISRAERPPIVQYPGLPVGIEPSTITRYLPASSCTTRSRTALACLPAAAMMRSEEHTSELQSLRHLVCRLLLEKKQKKPPPAHGVAAIGDLIACVYGRVER